ncbi:MAG: permease-like cell division protein FtsX [Rugosibacter sp.]
MLIWLAQHGHAARLALRRLTKAPVNTLLSLFAIGVALALPTGGHLLLDNARQLAGTASATPQISIFLAVDAGRDAADEISVRLKNHAAVKQQKFLPREETLQRMKASSGLRDVIEALSSNPFPDAFVVTAADDRIETLEPLVAEFRAWPKVGNVHLDSAWVRRLDALLTLGHNAVILLGALLAGGLIAMTFNIIRLQVLTHHAEIEVSQLLGATDGFIRRPFLYYGALLGLGSGIAAWCLVNAAAWWLRLPLGGLLQLYDLSFTLQALGIRDSALLLVCATGLGWLGALLSLTQHLRQA